MTAAAAAVTLAIVGGVIAGPSILRCSGSPEGLLACLRQQVVDFGLLPETETITSSAPLPATPRPVAPLPTAPVEPDIDLVRAEPDGHVIVAGTAPPGAEIEVFASGKLIGSARAEASGDWVLVPDGPLAVGTAEISVGIMGSNARSPNSFTVVIPADKASAPVIMVPQPLPPTASPPATEPQPTQPAAVVEPPPASPADPATEVTVTAPSAPQISVAPEPAPAPAPVEQAVAEPQPDPLPPILDPIPIESPKLSEPPVQTAEIAPAPPIEPPLEITPVPAAPASIDAIEIDGTANYFAGAGPEGAVVELYVQDRFIASGKVEGGRWLVEAQGALTLPAQRVRIDLIRPQQGDVSARAEVNFVIDTPPPPPEIEMSATGSGMAAPAASASATLVIAPQVEPQLELDPSIPTLRALPSVDPNMLRFASGKAIIRRGETLWAIARRVYGDGSLYPRIVEANDGLIKSPGRIFPGQVFDLPKLPDQPAAN